MQCDIGADISIFWRGSGCPVYTHTHVPGAGAGRGRGGGRGGGRLGRDGTLVSPYHPRALEVDDPFGLLQCKTYVHTHTHKHAQHTHTQSKKHIQIHAHTHTTHWALHVFARVRVRSVVVSECVSSENGPWPVLPRWTRWWCFRRDC